MGTMTVTIPAASTFSATASGNVISGLPSNVVVTISVANAVYQTNGTNETSVTVNVSVPGTYSAMLMAAGYYPKALTIIQS